MSIREIDQYTMYALGNGCFFNGDRQQSINDPYKGHFRKERVFSSDRQVEYEDEGVVEFGERAAAEIAHLLGWISPKVHDSLTETAAELERDLANEAMKREDAETALRANFMTSAEAIEQNIGLKDQVTELRSKLASANGALGAARKQVGQLTDKLKSLTDFGDD